jgi:hypothetical protein
VIKLLIALMNACAIIHAWLRKASEQAETDIGKIAMLLFCRPVFVVHCYIFALTYILQERKIERNERRLQREREYASHP